MEEKLFLSSKEDNANDHSIRPRTQILQFYEFLKAKTVVA